MKESEAAKELGVRIMELRSCEKKIRKIEKLAGKVRDELVKSGKFKHHEFSGAFADLASGRAALLNIDHSHSTMSDLIESRGVTMATDEELCAKCEEVGFPLLARSLSSGSTPR